ncbi:MAG TPA: chemotaxis protein CheW [Thermoanaerobaculia bacterium]|nr:chemotaxis protein CheW [Thermoanaerobaculia bacterium]
MVDLVKIRKKAKKQKDAEPAPPPVAPEPLPEPAPEPVPETQHSAPSTQHSVPTAKLEKFKQTAGTKREGFIDEVEETAEETQRELLTFVLAGEHYALDIEHIVEIVTPRSITRVPNAEEGIVGIISLRGTIVTVVDARRKLRHPPSKNGDHADRRIIVLEKGGETLGFEVDRVLRVVKTDPGAIEPHPVVHATELHEAIRGVFRHADALTILLDFDKLLA